MVSDTDFNLLWTWASGSISKCAAVNSAMKACMFTLHLTLTLTCSPRIRSPCVALEYGDLPIWSRFLYSLCYPKGQKQFPPAYLEQEQSVSPKSEDMNSHIPQLYIP